MNDSATLLPEEDARSQILALSTPLPGEWLPLDDALGRVLAEDVTAQRTLPPWDNSAMDGYAVRSADLGAPCPSGSMSGRPSTPVRCRSAPWCPACAPAS